jgi:Mg/Co/Ni transporter MgtE (contains CBS domain)
MFYLSQLLGAPVLDQHDRRVGKIIDVFILVSQVGQTEPAYPSTLLIESESGQQRRVPVTAIERVEGDWHLRTPLDLAQYASQSETPHEDEASLTHDVFDKQIIDLKHKKAVRVNDVSFSDSWQILGIDKSSHGLIRRLAPSWLQGALSQPPAHSLIPWSVVELLHSQHVSDLEAQGIQPVAASPSHHTLSGHLSELHPADIAAIIHQLTAEQGARVIERLADKLAAETMEEVDTERQSMILEDLDAEKAVRILREMGPDEIADLLKHLPEERAQTLLRQINPEDSEDVQELLEYEEDTAGGLMTTDFIVLNQTRTAQEALQAVRQNILDNDVRLAYIYCVADESQDESRPLGAISLWDLLIAPPSQMLQEFMEADLITVTPEATAHTVCEMLAKYNLLALPVVNAEGNIEGVVTVDDALDTLLPNERQRRTRRMY